jgi:hypothetical protein
MPGRLEFEFRFTRPQRPKRRRRTASVVAQGDFSGRQSQGAENPADVGGRRAVPVDVDSFDQRLAQFAPRLVLPLGPAGTPEQTITFSRLDDFHPDRLYQRLDLFRGLRDLRARPRTPPLSSRQPRPSPGCTPLHRKPRAQHPLHPTSRAGAGEGDVMTLSGCSPEAAGRGADAASARRTGRCH